MIATPHLFPGLAGIQRLWGARMIAVYIMKPQFLVPQCHRYVGARFVKIHPVVLGFEVGTDVAYLDEGLALPDVGFAVA